MLLMGTGFLVCMLVSRGGLALPGLFSGVADLGGRRLPGLAMNRAYTRRRGALLRGSTLANGGCGRRRNSGLHRVRP